MPPMLMAPCSVSTITAASFGRVSVVMMARAARGPFAGDRLRAASAMPALIFSMGNCRPITPVEQTSTSSSGKPVARATSAAICTQRRMPSSPVQALAMPLLMTMACARPVRTCFAL